MDGKDGKKAPPRQDEPDEDSDESEEEFHCSEDTLTKVEACKLEMEQYYVNLFRFLSERNQRLIFQTKKFGPFFFSFLAANFEQASEA